MSPLTTRYVTIGRRWQPRAKRWTTYIGTSTDRPSEFAANPAIVGVYETKARSNDEAAGIVAEWLATGRPGIMDVIEMKS